MIGITASCRPGSRFANRLAGDSDNIMVSATFIDQSCLMKTRSGKSPNTNSVTAQSHMV